MKKFGTRCFTS